MTEEQSAEQIRARDAWIRDVLYKAWVYVEAYRDGRRPSLEEQWPLTKLLMDEYCKRPPDWFRYNMGHETDSVASVLWKRFVCDPMCESYCRFCSRERQRMQDDVDRDAVQRASQSKSG